MSASYVIRFGAALAVALCSCTSFAQSSIDTSTTSTQETPEAKDASDSGAGKEEAQQAPTYRTQETQYVPSLDGSGLISLNSFVKLHLLIGGTASTGIDSNPANLSNGMSSAVYSLSPYVSLEEGSSRTRYLFQYQPTIRRYSSYAGNTLQVASAKIVQSISPHWNWSLDVGGSYGPDSLRLTAPSQSVSVGGVPGVGPSSSSFLPNAGTVTNLSGSFDLYHEASPRDAIEIQTADYHNASPSLHENSNVATASFNYTHALTRKFSILAYQQTSQYYGDLACSTFGAGSGVYWQPRESAYLSFKVGPQLNSSNCKVQQGFAYSASLGMKLPGRSQLYLLADRRPVTGNLGPGLWQDDISGGYRRQVSRKDSIGTDAGFSHSSTLLKTGTYHEVFYYAYYAHTLRRGLSLGANYRSYIGNSGGIGVDRNMLLFSLSWTPNTQQDTQ